MKTVGASRSSHRQAGGRPPGTAIIVGVFVAILILFSWLHFIVAQQNEATGREIQARTEELARIERENMALRRKVAAAYAEPEMAGRAFTLGYQAQQPLYLLLSHPLPPAARGSHGEALLFPSIQGFVPPPASGASEAPTTTSGQAPEDGPTLTTARRP